MPRKLEIQRTLVVNRAHLPPTYQEFLQDQVLHRVGQWYRAHASSQLIVDQIGCVAFDTLGWRVCLAEGDGATEYLTHHKGHGALAELIHLALNNGCDWLVIDRDGPFVEGMPVFSQEEV